MAEMMAKQRKSRSTKVRVPILPLFLNLRFDNLKNLLDEMADAFMNSTHLDSFNHLCKMSGSDVRGLKKKYSFSSCIKVCELGYSGRTCN